MVDTMEMEDTVLKVFGALSMDPFQIDTNAYIDLLKLLSKRLYP